MTRNALASASAPEKLNFRFVLGLILMRKRLLDLLRQNGEDEIRRPREAPRPPATGRRALPGRSTR